jgi:predicted nucleic acid-binding protein
MYLLDTNAVIDFCNAKLPAKAKQFMLSINQPTISAITQIELFSSTKIPNNERLRLQQFVQIGKVFNTINLDIIERTIAIRQQHKTKLPDAIIAATALVHNLTLITHNTADFKNIADLKMIDPHSL